jgi:transcriptional regulator with XRE-family HTH domain
MVNRKKYPIEHAPVVVRFGQRLREVRLSRGMTQAQLSRQANISIAYIGRLELGKAAVGLDLLDRLASALGCGLSDLLPTPIVPSVPDAAFKEHARQLFEALLASADQGMLLFLGQLLARLSGSIR